MSEAEGSNCLCVPTSSCEAVLGGNATEPETDGSGLIDVRIMNVSKSQGLHLKHLFV